MSSGAYYGDFSLPIAFSNKIFGCYAMDIIGGSSSDKMTEASFSWVQGDSTGRNFYGLCCSLLHKSPLLPESQSIQPASACHAQTLQRQNAASGGQ